MHIICGDTMPDEHTLTVRFNLKIPEQRRIWDWLNSDGNRSERVRGILLAHIMGQQGDVTNQQLLVELRALKDLFQQGDIQFTEVAMVKQSRVNNPRAESALRGYAENG